MLFHNKFMIVKQKSPGPNLFESAIVLMLQIYCNLRIYSVTNGIMSNIILYVNISDPRTNSDRMPEKMS